MGATKNIAIMMARRTGRGFRREFGSIGLRPPWSCDRSSIMQRRTRRRNFPAVTKGHSGWGTPKRLKVADPADTRVPERSILHGFLKAEAGPAPKSASHR